MPRVVIPLEVLIRHESLERQATFELHFVQSIESSEADHEAIRCAGGDGGPQLTATTPHALAASHAKSGLTQLKLNSTAATLATKDVDHRSVPKCWSDLHTIESGWGPTIYPCVVGHEIVGEVTLAGSDVRGLKVGDRVGVGAQVWACLNKDPAAPCKECASGDDAYCAHKIWT